MLLRDAGEQTDAINIRINYCNIYLHCITFILGGTVLLALFYKHILMR